MQIGIIGLGRMGGNMARRLQRAGHRCVVHAKSKETLAEFTAAGMVAAANPAELVALLEPPRAVWIMLPAGDVTEGMVEMLGNLASPGDVVIDGGNTFYKDDIRRAKALEAKGIAYLDVGTSGGIWGLERGYCLMIGGPEAAVEHLEPILADLAPGGSGIEPAAGREGRDRRAERGYIHAGPSGAGHFVKMVHNGIEYGMMQAYAEGFDLLRANGRYELDLADVAEVWRRGSVVSSWLLDLTAAALAADENLTRFTGSVADSGEGRWTIEAAIESGVPVHVLAASLFARFRSRKEGTFADKLLSAMRFEFGGHVEPPRRA